MWSFMVVKADSKLMAVDARELTTKRGTVCADSCNRSKNRRRPAPKNYIKFFDRLLLCKWAADIFPGMKMRDFRISLSYRLIFYFGETFSLTDIGEQLTAFGCWSSWVKQKGNEEV